MTAAQHLDQARRALLTDQPNVAMLHMQRAREENVLDRFMMKLVSGIATRNALPDLRPIP